jgi:hypothetical protein
VLAVRALLIFVGAASLGGLLAIPLIGEAGGAVNGVAAVAGPELPEPLFGAWRSAGAGVDRSGRAIAHGFALSDSGLTASAQRIAANWARAGHSGQVTATDDDGIFLTYVDWASGHQESYHLQPTGRGVAVWVSVAELDLSAGDRSAGPALGGWGRRTQSALPGSVAQNAERLGAVQRAEGWTLVIESPIEGGLLRTWTRRAEARQERFVTRSSGGVLHTLIDLPDREPSPL